MFGMGWPEMFVIALVSTVVFGPDKLPGLARQAGSFVRTVRQMAETAKNDLGQNLGHDMSSVNLRDLDPREVVRQALDDQPGPADGPTVTYLETPVGLDVSEPGPGVSDEGSLEAEGAK